MRMIPWYPAMCQNDARVLRLIWNPLGVGVWEKSLFVHTLRCSFPFTLSPLRSNPQQRNSRCVRPAGGVPGGHGHAGHPCGPPMCQR